MKTIFLLFLLTGFFGNSIQTISRINRYAKEAAIAYEQQNYDYAIAAYTYLLDELGVQDDQIHLNLAHAHYRAQNIAQAGQAYEQLINHPSQRIRAMASLQLGNVAVFQKKYKKALNLYRSALISDPGNESARYNFELLTKYLDIHPELLQEEEEEEPITPDPQAAENLPAPPPAFDEEMPAPKMIPDEQGNTQEEIDSKEQAENGTSEEAGGSSNQQESKQPGEQEKEEPAGQEAGDVLGQSSESGTGLGQQQPASGEAMTEQDQRAQMQRARLQQMNLSPEKAQQLLDAMRNAELQYIQQLPRKATKKQDKNKPDW